MESIIAGNEVFIGTIGVLVIGVFIAFITLGGLESGLGDDGDFGDCD